MRFALLASAAMVSVLAAGAASAQQSQEGEVEAVVVTGSQVELPRPYEGGQVARGGRVGMFGALDVMDTPFSTTNYTEELARNQQAVSVGDILQNDPVVRVAKGFGNFQELYVIRGFPVYSDDMTYNGVYGILPRQFVAAEFLERVEVFHGATAFLNGAAPGGSGVGGAFNLVPKRAPDEGLSRLTAGVEGGGAIYGAFDGANRFGADGRYGLRLNIAGRDGETSVEDQERRLLLAGLGFDYRGERFRFSADIGIQDHRIDRPRPSVTPTGAIPSPPDPDKNFAQPWTYTDERQLFGVVRGEFDATDDISLWVAFGGRDGKESNVLANPNVDATGAMTAYRFDNTREDSILSADLGLRWTFDTGPVAHRFVLSGAATSLESRNAYAFSSFFTPFATDLYNPVDAPKPAATFFVGGSASDPHVTERVDNRSFAIADMLTFLDDKVIVTLGARWQEIDTATYDYNTGARIGGYKADAITPAVAVVYKATDQISIYANYTEALIPGQIAPATSGGVPVVNAGEVLDPFRGRQVELGLKFDTGRFGGTASVFSITLPSAFVQNNRFDTNGEQENRGVEFSVFGEPAEGLRVLGGLTWVDAELTKTAGGALDGTRPIGVPEWQANANLEYDLPFAPGLTLDGRVVYTGEQPANAANTVDLDSWTRLDLGARYTVTISEKPVTFRARVENVTDEAYWASTGGYPGANYLVLGGPRTFVLSASVDF
ncbi:TonB-dependent siderophore receptor [Caulobacter sp. SLTY]|uniref:TonB-dependent receptor n=1 Tax=Caulobacter sp. SLTY TaxID=2683262 RepID=UPI0014127A7C|nr:TonB-dependent receptor [Caulobacter sp. SLTY]NBB15996.1 TonB-dependent siderophore receptor [Caulobacter sp. SLTY]